MIIQMVACQVGKPGGGQMQPVQPALLQPVGGGFQRNMLNPCLREGRQPIGQSNRVRCGEGGHGYAQTVHACQPKRANPSGFQPL